MSKKDPKKAGKHISNSKNVVEGSHIEGQNIHIGDIIYSGHSPTPQVNDNQQNTDEVRKLIGQGKASKALEVLQQLLQDKGERDLINESVLLSSRLASLQREQRMGIITSSNAAIKAAQINHAILGLANEI